VANPLDLGGSIFRALRAASATTRAGRARIIPAYGAIHAIEDARRDPDRPSQAFPSITYNIVNVGTANSKGTGVTLGVTVKAKSRYGMHAAFGNVFGSPRRKVSRFSPPGLGAANRYAAVRLIGTTFPPAAHCSTIPAQVFKRSRRSAKY
jgi:hypothetical protein